MIADSAGSHLDPTQDWTASQVSSQTVHFQPDGYVSGTPATRAVSSGRMASSSFPQEAGFER
jgi:hypothetical protein